MRKIASTFLWFIAVTAHAWEPGDSACLRFDHTDDRLAVTESLTARFVSERDSSRLIVGNGNSSAGIEILLGNRDARVELTGVGPSQRAEIRAACASQAIYRRSESELEWEIILDSATSGPVFVYPIELNNIDCFYQPPLTENDINVGAERPDSVIGSYAFYDADSGKKLFHLYRPRARDSTGDTVWCDQAIDRESGVLRLSVPRDFLGKAAFPVTIDPTFGFTSSGASTIPVAGTVCYANKVDSHPAAVGDRVVQIHGWFRGVGDGSLDMAIYSLLSGVPNARLAAPVTVPITNSALVKLNSSAIISQPLASGVAYVVSFGAEVGDIRYAYDTQPAAASIYTASASLPAIWVEGAATDRRISIYVTYEEGGGPEISVPRRRRRF